MEGGSHKGMSKRKVEGKSGDIKLDWAEDITCEEIQQCITPNEIIEIIKMRAKRNKTIPPIEKMILDLAKDHKILFLQRDCLEDLKKK